MNIHDCHKCYFQLLSFEKSFRQFTQMKVGSNDLTVGQMMLLSYLYENGSFGQKELTVTFNSSSAAMAVSIARLEEEGMVCKTPDESDKRNNIISITEKGTEYLLSFTKNAGKKPEERADDIGRFISEEDISQLMSLQRKLVNEMKAIIDTI